MFPYISSHDFDDFINVFFFPCSVWVGIAVSGVLLVFYVHELSALYVLLCEFLRCLYLDLRILFKMRC
jgi:hypothetical protein